MRYICRLSLKKGLLQQCRMHGNPKIKTPRSLAKCFNLRLYAKNKASAGRVLTL
jgi:DNA-binding phage protein